MQAMQDEKSQRTGDLWPADGIRRRQADAQIMRRWAGALLWGLLWLGCWDASGLDMTITRWYGDAHGFVWRDHPLLSRVLHDQARQLGWVMVWGITAWAVWPMGVWRTASRGERWGLVAAIWLSLLLIVALKRWSLSSCPWDLAEFGGKAVYVSHWVWGVADGGGGHCFPGGHASTAFALFALPLWLWSRSPVWSRSLLVLVWLIGLGLGWVQQMRGAHHLSHNLWTAWLCAATAWAVRWQVLRLNRPPEHRP